MSTLLHELRKHLHPRAEWSAWGPGKPVRASDIILGLLLVIGFVVLAAYALTYLFATA